MKGDAEYNDKEILFLPGSRFHLKANLKLHMVTRAIHPAESQAFRLSDTGMVASQ